MICTYSTIRFGKMMSEIASKRHYYEGTKVKLSYREFIKIMIKVSDNAYPKMDQSKRMLQLLTVMDT